MIDPVFILSADKRSRVFGSLVAPFLLPGFMPRHKAEAHNDDSEKASDKQTDSKADPPIHTIIPHLFFKSISTIKIKYEEPEKHFAFPALRFIAS
ncbi:MAG: hypothetical protein KBS76_05675 [Ruminococcus sp.]|nr:hypothetical protein [Candidatus Apopatosoma intestinale]